MCRRSGVAVKNGEAYLVMRLPGGGAFFESAFNRNTETTRCSSEVCVEH